MDDFRKLPETGTAEACWVELQGRMAASGIDALVLRPSPDFRYLGGRWDGFLVVPASGPPVEVDGPEPVAGLLGAARRVGIDPEMRASELLALGLEGDLVLASAVLAPMRMRKRPPELAALERAALAADAVLDAALELPWFGVSERRMARTLRMLLAEAGCEEVLGVRVASGEHTSCPDRAPTDRVINPGDAVLVGVCGRWEGYVASPSRVVAVAEPPEDYEAMHSVVIAASAAACEAVRPGAMAAEVDLAAREAIEGSGFGDYATAGAGHGVGLSPEEAPWLVPGDDTPLAAGMALSIGPGVVLPELYGAVVRFTVVCMDSGPAQALNPLPGSLPVLER
ncbi:M24 family metallopeptidase [Sinosporangium siamense]|uniref:Dipeptidase n=1 Tax=Sinosporangium siamense TaxID=1367973 RepID=A0A919RDH4_9ACTN|nr:M24 family metallopeptidase [Sinosporangium siamense]GII91911.1 dipeptidase [Sinosporangium siamense]